MSTENIKRDPIIKSIFDEGGLEQPSGSFTRNIIKAIKSQSQDSVFVYKPVISKKAWLIIALLGCSLFIYLLLGGAAEGQGPQYFGVKLNFDTAIISGLFSKIAFSFTLSPILKTSLLALIFFTFSNLIIFELRNRSFFK